MKVRHISIHTVRHQSYLISHGSWPHISLFIESKFFAHLIKVFNHATTKDFVLGMFGWGAGRRNEVKINLFVKKMQSVSALPWQKCSLQQHCVRADLRNLRLNIIQIVFKMLYILEPFLLRLHLELALGFKLGNRLTEKKIK
jgi:hypothetical protein